MTYAELYEMFNFPLPEYARELYEGFVSQYDREVPVLSSEKVLLVAEKTHLPDDGRDALLRCAKVIDSSDDAHLCASFLAYVMVYKREPWQNYIYSENLFDVEGLENEQVWWVLVAVQLAHTLTCKQPPEDLNEENVGAFYGYSLACLEQKGYWGVVEWNWTMLSAGGCMFVFDILKYVPSEFTGDFPVITDGKRYISLVGNSFFVGKEGELVDCEEKSVFKTSFYEDDEKYVGHIIREDGYVESQPTEFLKNSWSDFLRGGSHTMEIHIPPHVEYTPERMKYAHRMALDFYKEYYPTHKPKAIVCYSWLYSPQLKKVLPEDSNILAVNSRLHLLPVLAAFDENCRFLRQGSSLQRRIADECAKGTEFHYGICYLPLDEIEKL